MPTESLVAELEARHAQDIYDMVAAIKRKVRSALRDVVAETVDDPEDIERDLRALLSYLSA